MVPCPLPSLRERGLAAVLFDEALNDVAVDVGDSEVAALVGEGEALVVYTHEVQDRSLQVVDVDGALVELVLRGADRVAVLVGDVVSVVVGAAVGRSGVAAAAGHEDGEASGVVVAAERLRL